MSTHTCIHGVTSIKVGTVIDRGDHRVRKVMMRARGMDVEFTLFAPAPDPDCLEIEFVDTDDPE